MLYLNITNQQNESQQPPNLIVHTYAICYQRHDAIIRTILFSRNHDNILNQYTLQLEVSLN